MRHTQAAAGFFFVCLISGLVLFSNLGGYSLWDPDEGRHAEIARELFTAEGPRGWILPSLNFRPYYDKPILFYWLVSASYALGGVNELAARAVPALAALGTMLAVYVLAVTEWGVGAGLAAALVLVTSGGFVGLGRYANLDMLLTLWITLGILAFHRWSRRAGAGASLAPAAACAGLGMLTKGLVAPVLVGGIGLLYLALSRQLHLLVHARPVRVAATFFAVAGPWYAAVWFLEPDYLREFFLRHHYERFFGGVPSFHPGPIYYYVPMLVLCFFPWSVLIPATVRGTLARSRRGTLELLCLCWAASVLLCFSLSQGKLGTYILPAFPPLALLTGRYISDLVTRQSLPPEEQRLIGGGILFAVGVFFVALPVLLVLTWRIYDGAWMGTSLFSAVMIPVGVVLVRLLRRGYHPVTPIVLGTGFFVGLLVFYRWVAPSISAVRSEAPLAAVIDASGPAGRAPIVTYCARPTSLLFYLGRPVHEIDRPQKLERFLTEHPLVLVVTDPRDVPHVRAAGARFPWHTGARHVLYASLPFPGTPITDSGAPQGRKPVVSSAAPPPSRR